MSVESIKLKLHEIEKLEKKNIFDNSNVQIELKNFFIDVINFNKADLSISFYDFYSESHKKNIFQKDSKKILNKLRVQKSRLNTYLKKHSYSIDRYYRITYIGNMSLETLLTESKEQLSGLKIKKIKIFDSYQNENKNFIFSHEHQIFLEKIMENESACVEIISIINDETTKDFTNNLLSFNFEHKNLYNLNIQYIQKPIVKSLSLIYILLIDDNNNKYIIYYEDITKWSVITKVSDNIVFTEKFYQLLETRFNYFLNDDELKKYHEVIPINLNIFKGHFSEKVQLLTIGMERLLSSKLKNIQAKEIIDKSNLLMIQLKKIKIAFPKMNYAYMVLYHYIKLIEIYSLLKVNKESIPNTEITLKELNSMDIIKDLSVKLQTQLVQDKFLIKKSNITKIKAKEIKKKIDTVLINKKNVLSEQFNSLLLNDRDTIIDSLNKILLDRDLALDFLDSYIKGKVSEYLLNNINCIKYVIRQIFDFYGIEMNADIINLSDTDFKEINILKFINKKIDIHINKLRIQ